MESISKIINLFQEISSGFPKLSMFFMMVFSILIGAIVVAKLMGLLLKSCSGIIKEMMDIINSIEIGKCKHKELKIKTRKKERELSKWEFETGTKEKMSFLRKIRNIIVSKVHIKALEK